MSSSKLKTVSIQHTAAPKKPSKAQKQFNTLTQKIDAQKKRLLQWQETIPLIQQKAAGEYRTLSEEYGTQRAALVNLFDRSYADKRFKKTDKSKLEHLIVSITAGLIEDHGMDDLKPLYNKYSDYDFDADREENDAEMAAMMKSMLEEVLGEELDDDLDFSSFENLQAGMDEILREREAKAEAAEARRSQRKKTAKQLEKEAKQQEEEQNISKSIREVYRKLSMALHPDREQDDNERERKTELMKQVNAAYEKKDLLRLLGLQLEIEQVDQAHLNNIAEDRLKHFNKLLKEQLEELQQEIADLEYQYKLLLQLPPFMPLSPKELMSTLDRDIRNLRGDIAGIKQDLKTFADPANLKAWLKHYKIPKHPTQDDLFFGVDEF
ncbi:hypothetical protein RP726_07935 [Candidatus Methylospira mobilis]|uniref:hypothetical protein n=1 Tax=Candidatus Methylospira mobilis TaxID=1808979 RepID=UPI0028E4F8F9|nr:hypothetical protein [Candidatus Methylospira mobilis]WNV06324.1 hypothetical protein RP726_07935 [Candidatus Methylospira mobilis]